jgi:glycerate kinase
VNVLIAPDSHKGGPDASHVASTIADAWRNSRPDDVITSIPIADGGEGTADILARATGGKTFPLKAPGPLGTAIETDWVLLGDGKSAVIELARTSGLALIPENRRNPLRATTRGMGDAILEAIQRGATDLILSVGGSSSNDGGAGLAAALGYILVDDSGLPVPDGATGILSATKLRITPHPLLEKVKRVRVAVDVQNPLTGPNGAAAIYGPQKGATASDIDVLDRCMEHWLEITGLSSFPGAGAAGGTPVGIRLVFPDATFEPGISLVLDACGFDDALKHADLVITSEGCFDRQTHMGKAISGVAARAAAAGVPVIVIAGMVDVPSLAQSALPGYTFHHVEASSSGPIADVAQRITNLRAATARVAKQIETILQP